MVGRTRAGDVVKKKICEGNPKFGGEEEGIEALKFHSLSRSLSLSLSLSLSHGYRAIAPDLRGFGDTDAPPSSESYTIFHIVGDLIALIDTLGLQQVFVVGHDWGAVIAWYFCLFRPDRMKTLVILMRPSQAETQIKRRMGIGSHISERRLLDDLGRMGLNESIVRRALLIMHQRDEVEYKRERRVILRKT